MADVTGAKRKMTAEEALKHLNDAGVIKPDATISQLMKAVAADEQKSGQADVTVLFDGDKYLLIMA